MSARVLDHTHATDAVTAPIAVAPLFTLEDTAEPEALQDCRGTQLVHLQP